MTRRLMVTLDVEPRIADGHDTLTSPTDIVDAVLEELSGLDYEDDDGRSFLIVNAAVDDAT